MLICSTIGTAKQLQMVLNFFEAIIFKLFHKIDFSVFSSKFHDIINVKLCKKTLEDTVRVYTVCTYSFQLPNQSFLLIKKIKKIKICDNKNTAEKKLELKCT